jgi:peptidoglycan/xylan/chitin deacetylase (PgdA/CDA1 family)
VPVLCFHQVRDWQSGDGSSARPIITPPGRLAEQCAALASAGYSTITPDQVVSYLEYGTPLPPKPVMLSFDDGSEGQYTNALPILLRHHFVATFFVMTVALDKPTWLTGAQVRELHSRGMTIGAHTYDHHPVTEYTGTDWQTQLVEPAQQLTHLTGQPVRHFAYPYGVWNRAALPHVRAAGYHAAFQLADTRDSQEPLLTIRRIIAPSAWSGTDLVHATDDSFHRG